MAVTVAQIKDLNVRTGAGIMDCKKALVEADGDVEKAIDILREKGIAKAASKAGRVAAEGLANIEICTKCNRAAIVEVNCETDFVSSSDKFHEFVANVTHKILENNPASVEEATELTKDLFGDATIAMGEKFVIRRFEVVDAKEGQVFGQYSHGQGKIAALVLLSKDCGDLNKGFAMNVVSANPTYLSMDEVPSEIVERETEIARNEVATDEKLASKPEAVKENIIKNKVKKVLSASCLLEQPFVYDDTKTVAQALKENGVEMIKFVMYHVGEGIEKKAE